MFLKFSLIVSTILLLALGYFLIPPRLLDHHLQYPNHNLTTNPLMVVSNKPIIPQLLSLKFTPTLPGSLSCLNLTTCQFNQSQDYAPSTTYQVQYQYMGITLAEFELQTPPPETLESIFQKNALDVAQNYPLAYQLPYITDNLKISYLGPLKLKVAYRGISEEDALNQVRIFMETNNLSPSSHTYDLIHQSTN